MEALKVKFLDNNFMDYPETYDAFAYFQECMTDLSIEGMGPLINLLGINPVQKRKNIKTGHRRNRIRVYFANFGHPTVQWLGGGIRFEDGGVKPDLYLYLSSKTKNCAEIINSICTELPARDYLAEPSSKNREINISFQKNPNVKSLKELQAGMLELSSAVAKVLGGVLPK